MVFINNSNYKLRLDLSNIRNNIMKLVTYTLAVAGLLLGGGVAAHAFPVVVNVVHGIDGRELGAARELPVDIAINGGCALKRVAFSQSAIIDADAGETYKVTVHPADGKCSATPVISESLTIPNDGTTALSVVASLSAKGAPQLAVFNSTPRFFGIELAQVSVRNLVKSQPLFVQFKASPGGTTKRRSIQNGQADYYLDDADRFSYRARVATSAKGTPKFNLTGVASKKMVTHYNIVGSAKNGFTVIKEEFDALRNMR